MEKNRKVELLSPAGNYESFLGAVHAGADAVYLGGEKFGARAYADNFTTKQLCSAIRYAHLYGRKVYLTLNTLIKEKEMPQLYDYLSPFYEAGLDGIIIQDMGVFLYVREHFPGLPLHVSTQMAITGVEGVRKLKQLGAKRVVPARELTLGEIRRIKKETDIEIETFIHGAMCYCYSGQCLFSSILGGRSGNRGKCAQPCRLPYKVGKKGKEAYYLSLKDMCTIERIPELIEAGIDSFKIEGRMKKPEYTAGVTAVYRKYIDLYYDNIVYEELPDNVKTEKLSVAKRDMEVLKSLYIRDEVQDGYYNRHNGACMVTKGKPGYAGSDEGLLKEIRERYIEKSPRIPVKGEIFLKEGANALFSVEAEGVRAAAEGGAVFPALKQPMTKESIKKQLEKCGNTPFFMEQLTIDAGENLFLPLKELNEIRRKALGQLEEELIKKNGGAGRKAGNPFYEAEDRTAAGTKEGMDFPDGIYVLVRTKEQLGAVLEILRKQGKIPKSCIQAVFVSTDMLQLENDGTIGEEEKRKIKEAGSYVKGRVFAALPYVCRSKDMWITSGVPGEGLFCGALARNMEELALLQKDRGVIVTDTGLYVWNKRAAEFFGEEADFYTLPLELNGGEQKNVASRRSMQVVYGRIPMMVTANCIRETRGECMRKEAGKKISPKGGKETVLLTDRYGKEFPVAINCRHCYNVIYNSVPLSLHDEVKKGTGKYRLDFTTEDGEETGKVLEFFCRIYVKEEGRMPYKEYTTGHQKRGAV